MKTIDSNNKISKKVLNEMAEKTFGDLVKAVVDIEKGVMVVDAELHADQKKKLLDDGSVQECLWGINLYPNEEDKYFIEFDSMINLRPSWGNRSLGVDDKEIKEKAIEIVNNLVK